jgi:D-alanyl-D-alanine carboxypeptidase
MTKVLPLLTALLTASCMARPPSPPQAPPAARPDAVQPGPPADDLSALLDEYRVKGAMPGIGGAVWRDGRLVAIGVAGVRKLGDPTPVTVHDAWHLGSDTKAMTATLIGIYVDRGKLHFEDTVGDLFRGESIDPGWTNVRVEQLLEHRGGAPGSFPPGVFEQMHRDGKSRDARIRAVRALLALPPAQAPGTFVYSNSGYIILGAALERIAGAPWETLMERELFAPLQMRSCGFGPPGRREVVDAPWGHESRGDALVPMAPGPWADNPPALGPAGTVHCSLEDWGKFLSMHVAGARGEPTLVSPETMKRLQTPPEGGDYAAGWIVVTRPWAGGIALSHTGSNTMWVATTWLAPAKSLAFAVVTNRFGDVAVHTVDAASLALIRRYADEAPTPVPPPPR